MPWGPWVTPPIQVAGVIDQDGTVLDWQHVDWGEQFLGTGPQNGVGIGDEALRNIYFTGDNIATINSDTEQLLKNGGTPPSHHTRTRTVGGGHGIQISAQVGGFATGGPVDDLIQSSVFQLAHFQTPSDYSPPAYGTDPNITAIDYTGTHTMLDSWVAIATWATQNAGRLDEATSNPDSSGGHTLIMSHLEPGSWENVYYNYTGATAHWFDPARGLATPGIGVSGTVFDEVATPDGVYYDPEIDASTSFPAVQPLVYVYHLGPVPDPFLDSHRNYAVGGFPSCVRDGLAVKWSWVVTNTGARLRKFWSMAFVPHGVIQYQPRQYRLFYTHLPSNWGVNYVRMGP